MSLVTKVVHVSDIDVYGWWFVLALHTLSVHGNIDQKLICGWFW